jgi:hypothetical protein
MKFDYEEDSKYQFPFWFTTNELLTPITMESSMNISEWCSGLFGELGTTWGYFSSNEKIPVKKGNVTYGKTIKIYSWRFKNKEDAMLFKLTWVGE